MSNFKIIPLSKEYATEIRKSGKDKFGNDVIEQLSTGKGPCRISLRPFEVGKDVRVLLAHTPFEINNVFNQSGPIFIHKKEVEPYTDIYKFPSTIKADKQNFPLTLIGYNNLQKMVFTKIVGDDDVDLLIEKIFIDQPEIEFLHARNAEACCFICKIERI